MPEPDFAILQAFWHRGRQQCVPLMSHELARKLGTESQLFPLTAEARRAGHLTFTKVQEGYVYQLTAEGQEVVRARYQKEKSNV